VAWNRNALRRLVGGANEGMGPVRSNLSHYNAVAKETTPGALTDLWWPNNEPIADTKAAVVEESPAGGGLKTLYGACTRAIALEGDLWDLPFVSTPRPLLDDASRLMTH
jgi:hypothetical protein